MAPSVHQLLLITLCIYNAVAFDEETAELMKMLRDNCAEETGVDKGLIDQVNAGSDLTPDANLKCYCKCFMETAGMMTNGNIDVDGILAVLPQELNDKMGVHIVKCGTQKGADDCDTAYLTQVCWQKSNKVDYFLV